MLKKVPLSELATTSTGFSKPQLHFKNGSKITVHNGVAGWFDKGVSQEDIERVKRFVKDYTEKGKKKMTEKERTAREQYEEAEIAKAVKHVKARIAKEHGEDGSDTDSDFIDLTGGFEDYCGLKKQYGFPAEQDLAKYAVTKLVRKVGVTARDSRNLCNSPSTATIETDVKQSTAVFVNVTSNIEIHDDKGNLKATGMIQAIQFEQHYDVIFAAPTRAELETIESEYNKILEYSNYFQGKSLRFSADGVVFIPSPNISLEAAVLPEKIVDEYRLNVIEFLTDEKYHDITKKRALLLYGPPGGGKTTSLKALFTVLRDQSITCMYLTDDTFKNHSLESVFDFINKYLSPCLIGFEDIDLIGEDRRHTRGIIGSLLSVLNGVEDYQKPIVIIGTTNRADILDDAVTRPCRFDRKLFVDFPTTAALQKMFRNMMGFDPPDGTIVQSEDKSNKLTGAHVKEICDTAMILAKRNDKAPEDCVKEAVAIIKDSFYLASESVGFGRGNDDYGSEPDSDYPKEAQICTECGEDPFHNA